MNQPSTALSIYMNGRGLALPTQTLTVDGTKMAGFYVNGSVLGTANINFVNGATADLIEAGSTSAIGTNVNILVDGSVLNGAQTGRIYDLNNGGNKNFTLGSAIFIDLADLGNHSIDVVNGSQLNGSIVTGSVGNAQTVNLDRSTINNGGIYVLGGVNIVSMTNSTVDATNSQVAANLVAFAQRLANLQGTTVDVSGIDNLAIGLLGTQNNTLSVAGSTIIGDVGILSSGTTKISVTDGSRIEGNLTFRGAASANVAFDDSTIVGAIRTAGAGSTSSLTLIDSTWNLTGNSNVTNLTNDPSLIDFSPPVGEPTLLSSYKTLTVTNYVGEGGGIALNTYLGTDGSPSDRLVIDGGTATGTTTVIARDTGGGGALTTGDGILVIDAANGGTTAPGAFTGFATAGPYEYLLVRGGSTPGSENDWFLSSSLPPDPADPAGPRRPRFRQEVSLYSAIQPMAAI